MASRAFARFEGTAELLKNLDRYEKTLVGKELKPALMEAAELIRRDAAQRAPRDTGRLSDRMVAEYEPRRKRAKVGPHKDTYYGEFQELGTSRMAAQPFLRPALDANKGRAFEIIAKGLRKAQDRVAVRRSRR